MVYIGHKLEFPDISQATEDGLLAVGGDLSPERLLLAYQKGIFPWFETSQPILWWSPNPRMVMFPEELKVSKSMKKLLRQSEFEVTFNKAFKEVITECAVAERQDQHGTWITEEMIDAYTKLHELGHARSTEVWQDDKLVGGLYGVDLGTVFCGESMFAKVSNASKFGFISFIQNTKYKLIDCQVYTDHLASLGARQIPREEFLMYLT
ncbi:MAG: leucyl/phenylalanyl-tRNA--protein transferase [Flavobacteriaceae bacterium]|nr:leucyl/phenylalanyl-tRNA--protein transferase [Flavobacteriaceae bacterium]